MDYSTYYQKNTDVILKIAKDYYYYNIDPIRKTIRDKYKNLSEEDNEKVRVYQKYYREKMKNNISEEKKEKMREYQKNYRAKKKLQLSDSLSDSPKRPSSSSDEVITNSSSI